MPYSRRGLLRAALTGALASAVVPLAGCGLLDRKDPEPDPLDPLLAATVALAAKYDAAIAAQPDLAGRLTPLRDAHRAHAKALAGLIGRPESSLSPSPTAAGGTAPATTGAEETLAELGKAEKSGQDEAAAACLAAPTERTALLGSITAARATHQEVLK